MRFFDTVKASFYSADLYRRLRREGDYAFGYSLKLVALCSAVALLGLGFWLNQIVFTAQGGKPPLFDDAVLQIARQLPTMSVHANKLSTETPGATIIHLTLADGDKSKTYDLATIDTSGATSAASMKTLILVDAENFYLKSTRKTEVHPLNEFIGDAPSTLIINRALIDDTAARVIAYVHRSLAKLYFVFGLITWMFMTLYFYVARMVTLIVLAMGAKIISSARGHALRFNRAMAIAAVSFTPVALANTLAVVISGGSASGLTLLLAGSVTFWAALHGSRDATPTDTV